VWAAVSPRWEFPSVDVFSSPGPRLRAALSEAEFKRFDRELRTKLNLRAACSENLVSDAARSRGNRLPTFVASAAERGTQICKCGLTFALGYGVYSAALCSSSRLFSASQSSKHEITRRPLDHAIAGALAGVAVGMPAGAAFSVDAVKRQYEECLLIEARKTDRAAEPAYSGRKLGELKRTIFRDSLLRCGRNGVMGFALVWILSSAMR
jgi:hypothetical protein